MADVFDVIGMTEYEKGGERKTRFVRLGVAFPLKDGSPGMTINLDGLPAGDKSGYRLLVKPKQDRRDGGGHGGNQGNPSDIPF